VAPDSPDRITDLSYRLMAWTFQVADFLFPKHNRLSDFGIQPGFVVVDYGCGPGRYLAEASRLVGLTGEVYAVDIHSLAIEDVERLKTKLNLANVNPVLAQDYSCAVPEQAADLINALDMFHGVKDPPALLAEFYRMAKPRGVLVLEDGHQPRRKIKEKLAHSGLWLIQRETKAYVRCIAASHATASNLARLV
jgi:ubiquinone/menaquinone biosynthesis C-methylase UbiE